MPPHHWIAHYFSLQSLFKDYYFAILLGALIPLYNWKILYTIESEIVAELGPFILLGEKLKITLAYKISKFHCPYTNAQSMENK